MHHALHNSIFFAHFLAGILITLLVATRIASIMHTHSKEASSLCSHVLSTALPDNSSASESCNDNTHVPKAIEEESCLLCNAIFAQHSNTAHYCTVTTISHIIAYTPLLSIVPCTFSVFLSSVASRAPPSLKHFSYLSR